MNFSKILKKIKPSEQFIEKIENISEEFLNKLKENNISAYLGGSIAKNTFLGNIKDIDVYLVINSEEEVEILKEKIKKIFDNVKILKGSRDYFHIYYKNFLFECVPVLNIKNPKEAKNTTDISKFHVEYVKKQLKEKPYLRDEILLFKYFLKQKDLYGSETYKNGFSGYLSEVLVIHFGSFLNTIKFFSQVKKLPINILTNEENIKLFKKSGKYNGYFNICDPVLNERNLGMAVSKKKLLELIYYSKKFLIDFDFKKESFFDKLYNFWEKNKKILCDNYLLVEIEGDLTKLYEKYNNFDIIFSKFLKDIKHLINFLKNNNFVIIEGDLKTNKENLKATFNLIVSKNSYLIIKKAPLFLDNENFKKFLIKNKDNLKIIRDSLETVFPKIISFEELDISQIFKVKEIKYSLKIHK